MARKKKIEDPKGFGDSVANVLSSIGIDKVVEKVAEVLDVPCGCQGRQDFLNQLFPYDAKQGDNYVEIDGERIRMMN